MISLPELQEVSIERCVPLKSMNNDILRRSRASFNLRGADTLGDMVQMPQSTIFDKILSGEIPCHRVYEDERVLAFLDIGPLSRGHTLLIPKERKATLDQLSDESAAAIGRVLPRLCRAVMKATGATAYNILQNNGVEAHQAVMHVHFHIIPRFATEGLGLKWNAGTLEQGAAKDLIMKISSAFK
jgi:histidine triad (HIT) family protein